MSANLSIDGDDERPYNPPPTDPNTLAQLREHIDCLKTEADVAEFCSVMLARRTPLPNELRGSAYVKILLGPMGNEYVLNREPSAEEFQKKAVRAEKESPDTEQVRLDVVRTRAKLRHFQSENIRTAMVRLLCMFCLRERVEYLQGMNELLAPFMLVPTVGGRPRSVYFLMRSFVRRKLPFVLCARSSKSSETAGAGLGNGVGSTSSTQFGSSPPPPHTQQALGETADPFGGIRLCFQALTALLLYHDPQLAVYLKANYITCDFFAMSWFITAFSRSLHLELVYALWDCMVLDSRPCGLLFFALAVLTSRRDMLLSTSSAMLPETVTALRPTTADEVIKMWHLGAKMRDTCTPASFTTAMSNGIFDSFDPMQLVPVFSNPLACAVGCVVSAASDLKRTQRVEINAAEEKSGEQSSAQRALPLFVLDCRTRDEYDSGHFPRGAFVRLDAVRALSNPHFQQQQPQQAQQPQQELQHQGGKRGSAAAADSGGKQPFPAGRKLPHISSDPRFGRNNVNNRTAASPRGAVRTSGLMMSTQEHQRGGADQAQSGVGMKSPEDELGAAMELIRPLEGRVQLCLCGSGEISEDSTDVAQLCNHLVNRLHVRYVSILHDGFHSMLREHTSSKARGGAGDFELGAYKEHSYRAARAKRRLESGGQSAIGAKITARLEVARAGAGAGSNAWTNLFDRNQVAVSRLKNALTTMSISVQTRLSAGGGSSGGTGRGTTPGGAAGSGGSRQHSDLAASDS
eukprot:CAMPEP_0185848384 /NCGR_PEP_ID=MMETSP1354-20130828/3285_1 /TAXON_ID=708628 /ORGANISM="Erythrolobus madagascarensis, Strain CCMP3276" /LENGTH=744 /DNA_ID=CAMNT_0028548775 /DNA_START=21 /DNA_END=2255 /DNA_ORIENTATION=-